MSVSPYEENISLQPDFIRALSNGWRLEGQITFSFESDRYLDHAIKTTDQPASDDIQAILSGEPMLMPGNVLDASNSYMRGAVEAALKVISTYAQIDFQAEESGNAYLHFFTIDQLSNPSADTHTHGFGSYPKPDDTGAYAVFDTQLATNSADPEIDAGGVRDMVAVHEVLHNLGLYHPHDTDNQTIMLESSMDNTRFTVMSYNF